MKYNFEQIFIEHSSPLLARLKISSLFSVNFDNYDELCRKINKLNKTLNKKDIYIEIFKKFLAQKSVYLIFAYRKTLLEQRINEKLVNNFLCNYGYCNCSKVEDYIYVLRCKLICSPCFPHEIGIFLGYPLNDVIGFIKEKGQNFITCGVWKVYCNKTECEKIFSIYKKCKDIYTELYNKGQSIYKLAVAS